MCAFLQLNSPSAQLLHALGWYAREVLQVERLFGRVTVKRRRNPARPIRRRKSAFRDPMICLDFLAMAWLGVTRLSQIEPHLRARDELAQALGLPRFCDHTTAHNFLNAFHVTHLRQLDAANARLLRAHACAPHERAPILDVDTQQRALRRRGRSAPPYRWAVAFCAGEAIAQDLQVGAAAWSPIILELLARAREQLARRPALVRLAGSCVSSQLLAALARARLPFLATATWAWALAQRPEPRRNLRWTPLDDGCRALDLGSAAIGHSARSWVRTVLVERPPIAPGLSRERTAIVTSLLREAPAAIVPLARSIQRIRAFYGHPRWPLGDGKLPSGDARGNAAYLRLATIAMNTLTLFARHAAGGITPARLHAQLRLIPWEAGGRGPRPRARPAPLL